MVELRSTTAEAGLKYCSNLKKKDLIGLILKKREPEVKMTHYVLIDLGRKRDKELHSPHQERVAGVAQSRERKP